jgi:hypothetical protein
LFRVELESELERLLEAAPSEDDARRAARLASRSSITLFTAFGTLAETVVVGKKMMLAAL